MTTRIKVRWLLAFVAGSTLAAGAAGLAGCGGDDTAVGGTGDGGSDATTDHNVPLTDAGPDTSPQGDAADAACAPTQTACSGACVTLDTDPNNCGACAHACGANVACTGGHCGTEVTTVAAGVYFDCVARHDGTVWCWGSNENAELGTAPSAADRTCTEKHCNKTPQKIAGLADVVSVTTGTEFACALKKDGTVWCWGRNTVGQLGHAPGAGGDTLCDNAEVADPGEPPVTLPDGGSANQCNPTPSQVSIPGGAKVAKVVAGWAAGCALTAGGALDAGADAGAASGDVYCWGMNSYDVVGLHEDAGLSIPTPTKVPGFNGDAVDVEIALDTRNACAIRANGTVWCWGDYRLGRAGAPEGTGDDCTLNNCSPTPVQVKVQQADAGTDAGDVGLGAALDNVAALAIGSSSSCAIRKDGSVWCWGYDGWAVLGDVGPYDTSQHPGARTIPGLPSTIKALTTNTGTALATDNAGAVWGWGNNTFGTLGNGAFAGVKCPGSFDGGACVLPPATVAALAGLKQVTTGAWTGLALKSDGTVIAWGRNSHAQLGHTPGSGGDVTCVGPALVGITLDTTSCNATPATVTFP